uniref:Reverse transcriptase Ty1/copia-type domain-containing protein n=1 Tax=Cajanus cajan TaxID=3821 RepID=A0A151RMC7_CAJCA|nr:hypothetical protein KK1_034811 [Cajanus cajan]
MEAAPFTLATSPNLTSKSSTTRVVATGAKYGIVKPRLQPTLLLTHVEPKTTKQALSNPTWTAAMQTEYNALLHNGTWSLVPLPPHRTAIGCKWVFRVKENPNGTVQNYKARLVAKGFNQQFGFNYHETSNLSLFGSFSLLP